MRDSSETSVIIVTHNHEKFIKACLDSVLRQCPGEVIVIDNGSSDGTVDTVRKLYPNVKLAINLNNRGFGVGNNLGFKLSSGEKIIFLNPDTIVLDHWLDELIKPLMDRSRIVAAPKILTEDGTINTCGLIVHFTGLSFTRFSGAKPEEIDCSKTINGFSGACFALRREDFLELGGFDEDFFCYMEDTELSWRAKSKSFEVLFVESSVLVHFYEIRMNAQKFCLLERGRLLILCKYLSKREMFSILPSLVITELLIFGYAALSGPDYVKSKMQCYASLNCHQSSYNSLLHLSSLTCLDSGIPIPHLSDSRLEELAVSFSNAIYRVNLRISEKLLSR